MDGLKLLVTFGVMALVCVAAAVFAGILVDQLPAIHDYFSLLVFFGMVRPAMKALLAPPPAPEPGSHLDAVVADDETLPAIKAIQGPKALHQLEDARNLAKQNPAAVASIVRGWVSGEAA